MFGECAAFFIFMGPDSAQCSTKRRLWILKPNNFVTRSSICFTEENLVFLNQKSVWICLFLLWSNNGQCRYGSTCQCTRVVRIIILIFLIFEPSYFFIFNTSYLTDSYIIFTLKIESVSKITIFDLKMMVKSGLEKNIFGIPPCRSHFLLIHFTY